METKTMDDLRRLRDQPIAEQDKRDAEDLNGQKTIARFAKTAVRQTRPCEFSPRLPSWAVAVRAAAHLPPLDAADHSRVAKECIIRLTQQLGERYTPSRAAFETYHVHDPSGEQAAALDRVRAFVADMESVLLETRGLVLYGSVGTGKDHMLAAALYHVAFAGVPTAWVSGEQLYARVRDSMDTHEREENIIRPLIQPIVLGLSDPVNPRGELSDWDARILARLLDRRYRALRPTWIRADTHGRWRSHFNCQSPPERG